MLLYGGYDAALKLQSNEMWDRRGGRTFDMQQAKTTKCALLQQHNTAVTQRTSANEKRRRAEGDLVFELEGSSRVGSERERRKKIERRVKKQAAMSKRPNYR